MTPLLLTAVVKSLAILLVAALAVMSLRRASAAVRHIVWLFALISILTLPLLSVVLPVWRVTVAHAPSRLAPALSSPPYALNFSSVQETGQVGKSVFPRSLVRTQADEAQVQERNGPSPVFPAFVFFVGFYFFGFALVFLRWCFALIRIRRVGTRVNLTLADELARVLGVRRSVAVRLAPKTAPMTWGWRQAVILLPADALDWPDERLRVVLLHELAHVKRGDWLAQGVAQLACAVYWFLPPVWLAARQLRLESERACDDVVLSVGVPAPDYAGHLLEVLRAMKSVKISSPAALSMALPSTLETRVCAILSARANRRGASRPAVLLVSLLAACVVVPLAALQPVARAQAAPPVVKKPFVVVIDAGHGGADTGAVVKGVREKDWTLTSARRLRDALTQLGATVVLTRDSDTFLPVLERPKLARNAHADIFVSLHCEATLKPSARSGVTIFQHDGPQNAVLAKRLAAALGASGKTTVRIQNDTSRFASGFGVLRLAPMPAVLLECGDLSNPQDFARLQNPDAQAAFANALADALCQNAPQTESQWKKSLPGGVTFELLGVAEGKSAQNDPNPKAWWKPDGMQLAKPPSEYNIFTGASHTQGKRPIVFAFRSRVPTDTSEMMTFKVFPSREVEGGLSGSWNRGEMFHTNQLIAWLPENLERVTVSLGVARGAWRTQARAPGLAGAKTVILSSSPAVIHPNVEWPGSASMYAAWERRKTAGIEIIAPVALLKEQFRVIAIDKAGKTHEASGCILGKVEDGCQHLPATWNARELARQNVREYQFQTRSYHWVTFDKIALRPN